MLSYQDKLHVLKPFRSPRGFVIVPVHYSHDPEKDYDWLVQERKKYEDDARWQREQEIDFGAITGVPAYSSFRRELHLKEKLKIIKELPLCLCVDFNVEPMIWEIAQRHANDVVFVVDEIRLSPGNTVEAIQEFRRRYPAHPAGVRIYGDATGQARSSQTSQSDYDLIKLAMRTYPTEVRFFIPAVNPPVKARINAVNSRLLSPDGQPFIFIDANMCPELVKDLAEVVLDPGNPGNILKSRRRDDPYYYRTHASDALGYMIAYEWPVALQIIGPLAKKRRLRPIPSHVLGDLP